MMLKPEQLAPNLKFNLIDGTGWSVETSTPQSLTMLSIYRGAFCSFCRRHLLELEAMAGRFAERGVDIVATSADPADTAKAMAADLGLKQIRVGCGADLAVLSRSGVFITEVKRNGVAMRFAEPSLWLVRPDRRLYAIFQGSMSCARPDLASLLEGIEMLAGQGFPPRGNC